MNFVTQRTSTFVTASDGSEWLVDLDHCRLVLLGPPGTVLPWRTPGRLFALGETVMSTDDVLWYVDRRQLKSSKSRVSIPLPAPVFGRCEACYRALPPRQAGAGRIRRTCSDSCRQLFHRGQTF